MNIPDEIKEDINPNCPLATRIAVDMYTRDYQNFPTPESSGTRYFEDLYFSGLDHWNELQDLTCDLTSKEKYLFSMLNAIAWVMLSSHHKAPTSIYLVYLAMCEFETIQCKLSDVKLAMEAQT